VNNERANFVGIANMGFYLPTAIETSADIAAKSGLPIDTVEQKLGVHKKHIAGVREHVSDMAIEAARRALAGFDPLHLDAIIYFGSAYKDYPVWSCAAKIQFELGAKNAFATEIMSLCTSFTMALKIAKAMMLTDSTLNNVLLVGGSKESHLIDYGNPRVRFMYDFGDGAGAALLKKGLNKNVLLAEHHLTDGRFHRHIKVEAGGSVHPSYDGCAAAHDYKIDLVEGAEMKEHLDPVSVDNFVGVVLAALESCGHKLSDLDFVVPIHVKPSVHREILRGLGLSMEQSYYLSEYGHVQASDLILGLMEAEKAGSLQSGHLVALLGAGTGFTWGAAIVRWGEQAVVGSSHLVD